MKNYKEILNKLNHYFCPPGEGVYTVHTAKERKRALQEVLYPRSENIRDSWSKSLAAMEDQKQVLLFGICSDTGGGILRGANWGPLFIRMSLLDRFPELEYLDIGDIRVIPHFHHDKYLNSETIGSCRQFLYGDSSLDLPVSALSITEDILTDLYHLNSQARVFAIGGDHSVSYPLTKTYLQAKKRAGKKVSLIHFDAHTDLLESRLGVDICFGSWCTHILEYLPAPSHLIQLGIRSTGRSKNYWQSTYGIQQFWAEEINRDKKNIIQELSAFLDREKVDELYVSFDIDAIDDSYAPATGTPEPGGLIPEDVLDVLRQLSQQVPITGADIVEVAPFLRTESDKTGLGVESTLSVAADISHCLLKAMEK